LRVGGKRYRVPLPPLARALGLDESEVLARLRGGQR